MIACMGIVEDEQNAARADLRSAAEKTTQARADMEAAMRRAYEAKLSISEIARLAGVSRPTVTVWAQTLKPEE